MNRFEKMTTKELEMTLHNYSKCRSGEIAELTGEAAERIGLLRAHVKSLKAELKGLRGQGEDDLK